MRHVIGRYRGVDYKLQRICDVLTVDCRVRCYFTYYEGEPSCNHYRTLVEMKHAIDNGLHDEQAALVVGVESVQ